MRRRSYLFRIVCWLMIALTLRLAAPLPLLAASAGQGRMISIAVLDFQAREVEASLTKNLTDVMSYELTKMGRFKVITREEIETLISFEAEKQAMGCDDVSCLTEVGGALGVEKLISGSVGKVGGTYLVTIKLTDVASVTIDNRLTREVKGEDEALLKAVRQMTRELVAPLAEIGTRKTGSDDPGRLFIAGDLSDAQVYINDKPFELDESGRVKVALDGTYPLRIERPGFFPFTKKVTVKRGEEVTLTPTFISSKPTEMATDDDDDPWYTQWWVWVLGAVVVGGGVAAAAAGGGGGGGGGDGGGDDTGTLIIESDNPF